jgi:PAS domain S-box-containing protein
MSNALMQADFFASLADPLSLRAMFDQLPDVVFFIKDRQSRLVGGNRVLIERLGLACEADVVGQMDERFVPEKLARAFRVDDERVFTTREPLINRLEVWLTESGELDWFQTTKVPLFGKNGEVVGLMGTTRHDLNRATYKPETDLASVTSYLEEHTDRIVTNAELASQCGMSERTLNRKVNQVFGVTPYELMIRIRIQKAAEALLQTSAKVHDIAIAHGFCDQSTFTQHFRKRMGMTPRQFRVGHQV